MHKVLLVHAFSCWFMTGVIWLVQKLVYPFFRLIGKDEFKNCHQFHTRQITWIVAPVMTIELITGIWLLHQSFNQIFLWNLFSIVCLWVLTATVNVPAHNNLKYDSEISKKNLVYRNWFRTLIWSVRSLFLIWILW